ncbi:hypothetical protein ScPMuIL_002891 [Solemya velum]
MPCAVVESEEELQNLIEKIELDQGVKFVKHRQQHPTTTLSTMEQLPNSMNSVACGAVGPYTLYPTSFASIRTLVTDEVIDAYLHLITQNRGDIYHINCVVMTSIFCGRGNIHLHSLLQQVNIDNYTEYWGP